MATAIVVKVKVAANIEKVWTSWTTPSLITQWNFANDDWCCPSAENNFEVGGRFTSRMESKNGEMGFDFSGIYDEIIKYKFIRYTLDDGRKVSIKFNSLGDATEIVESFEPEATNTMEMQKTGWQMILDNFRKFVENS